MDNFALLHTSFDSTLHPLKWYFVTKIVLAHCEKKCSSDQEKLLKFVAEGREFQKKIEITRTIYSNSKKSQQVFVIGCFFNLFREVSHV